MRSEFTVLVATKSVCLFRVGYMRYLKIEDLSDDLLKACEDQLEENNKNSKV